MFLVKYFHFLVQKTKLKKDHEKGTLKQRKRTFEVPELPDCHVIVGCAKALGKVC